MPTVTEEELSGWYGPGAASSGEAASGNVTSIKNLRDYSNWHGDFESYLRYMAANGSESDYDRFMDYMMSEYSLDKGRRWTASREDTQYQRLVADLKAAGINPYALLQSGGSPVSSSSSGNSYTGAYSTNETLKKEQNSQKWLSILTTVLTTIIMAAAIAA